MEWSEEAAARQRQMEREIVCLKDTIWRLTSRIFVVESFVKSKYGSTALTPNNMHNYSATISHNDPSTVKVIPIVIPDENKQFMDNSESEAQDNNMGEQELMEDETIEDEDETSLEEGIMSQETVQEEIQQEEVIASSSAAASSSATVPETVRIYKPELKTFVTVKAEIPEPSDTQNPEPNLECHICHKKFDHKENVQRHILIHRATQYKCDECGRGFSHQGNLKTHKLRHQRVKQRQAEVERRQKLTQNQPQTDLENRKHPCSYCDKRFYTAQQRNIHTRIHTGEKPYECNLCGMKFNQKASLVDHALGHVGEKNNFCHLCPAGFVRSRNLLKHIRQVHKMAQIKTVVNGERLVEFVPEDEAAAIIESRKDNVEAKKPIKPRIKKQPQKTVNSSSSTVPANNDSDIKKPRRTARTNAGRNSKYENKDDFTEVPSEEYVC